MIKIIAKTRVPVEDQSAFILLAKPLVAASQAEEGNVFYQLHRSLTDPEELVFIEAWRDQQAIDAHNASSHFTDTLPKLAELCAVPMTIDRYEVLV